MLKTMSLTIYKVMKSYDGREDIWVHNNWMASCTSGLTNIKNTMKLYVIDSNNLGNIRVSHSGLDHLVTDFVTFLC